MVGLGFFGFPQVVAALGLLGNINGHQDFSKFMENKTAFF